MGKARNTREPDGLRVNSTRFTISYAPAGLLDAVPTQAASRSESGAVSADDFFPGLCPGSGGVCVGRFAGSGSVATRRDKRDRTRTAAIIAWWFGSWSES